MLYVFSNQKFWEDGRRYYDHQAELSYEIRMKVPRSLRLEHGKPHVVSTPPSFDYASLISPSPNYDILSGNVTRRNRDKMCLALLYTSLGNSWTQIVIPCTEPISVNNLLCEVTQEETESAANSKAILVHTIDNLDLDSSKPPGKFGAIQRHLCGRKNYFVFPLCHTFRCPSSFSLLDNAHYYDSMELNAVLELYNQFNIRSYLSRLCRKEHLGQTICMCLESANIKGIKLLSNLTRKQDEFYRCPANSLQLMSTCFSPAQLSKNRTLTVRKTPSLIVASDILLRILSEFTTIPVIFENIDTPSVWSRNSIFLIVSEPFLENKTCPVWMFTCRTGSCIHFSQVFDGTEHCIDGSDEIPWAGVCLKLPTFRNGSVDECGVCHLLDCQCADHLFQCKEGGCVSWEKVCDGVSHCLSGGDEICDTYIKGERLQTPGTQSGDSYSGRSFMCIKDGTSIPVEWVNDHVPDCSVTVISEEADTYLLSSRGKYFKIKEKSTIQMSISHFAEDESGIDTQNISSRHGGSLSCHRNGHQKFNFSQLCYLEYDIRGELKFCRSGIHLKHCSQIKCPGRYKCPSSYCISYNRICDSTVDCPYGEDEDGCPEGPVACPGMFRCSQLRCVHLDQVCDGVGDCHLSGDDETHCQLVTCPTTCLCRALSLFCPTPINFHIDLQHFLHARIRSVNVMLFSELHNWANVLSLNLSRNLLYQIRQHDLEHLQHVIMLDLSHNEIKFIHSDAFQNTITLRFLFLSNNSISEMSTNTFNLNNVLAEIDLSFNYLTRLNLYEYHTMNLLTVLTLTNNSIDNLVISKSNIDTTGFVSRQYDLAVDLTGNRISYVRGTLPEAVILIAPTPCLCYRIGFSQCSTNLTSPHKCSLINELSKVSQVFFITIGSVVTGSNLGALIHGSVHGISVSTLAIINLDISGVMLGLHLVMTGFKDIVYYPGYISPQLGPEYIWCMAAAVAHYLGVTIYIPTCVLHTYGLCYKLQHTGRSISRIKYQRVALLLWLVMSGFVISSILEDVAHEEVLISDACYLVSPITFSISIISVQLCLYATFYAIRRVYKCMVESEKRLANFNVTGIRQNNSLQVLMACLGRFIVVPLLIFVPEIVVSVYRMTGRRFSTLAELIILCLISVIAMVEPIIYIKQVFTK